jgi:hypothetical protein
VHVPSLTEMAAVGESGTWRMPRRPGPPHVRGRENRTSQSQSPGAPGTARRRHAHRRGRAWKRTCGTRHRRRFRRVSSSGASRAAVDSAVTRRSERERTARADHRNRLLPAHARRLDPPRGRIDTGGFASVAGGVASAERLPNDAEPGSRSCTIRGSPKVSTIVACGVAHRSGGSRGAPRYRGIGLGRSVDDWRRVRGCD